MSLCRRRLAWRVDVRFFLVGYDPYNSADVDPRVCRHRLERDEVRSFVAAQFARWLSSPVRS